MQPAADSSQTIWGTSHSGSRDFLKNKKSAAILLAAVAFIVAGVVVGLVVWSNSASTSNSVVGQGADSASIGCYKDTSDGRVMENMMSSDNMTPTTCQAHCDGYDFFSLQYGSECWCANDSDDFDIDVHGTGTCDMPCSGDSNYTCGGYWSFTAYETESVVCETDTPSFRFADSSDTAYVECGGTATLTDIYTAQLAAGRHDNGPLHVLDGNDDRVGDSSTQPTGNWLLTMNLYVYDGATLEMHGSAEGGDCDVLRIQSDGAKAFHEIRGHGGSLSFHSTKVTSWDTEAQEQQTVYEDGRSFINCVSEVMSENAACAKNDFGECRMDIIDSEMGDLGWMDSESYGLSWKVRGYCANGSNPEVFDEVNVYGDIKGSDIYGMYYGMYSYGHEGGIWTNNEMHDNILYGFDPHDDSDHVVIANNDVYGNGNHGIIASKRCNNVSIYGNEVYNGKEDAVGIFLHRSSDDAIVYDNYVHDMQDAGFAILESMNSEIYNNTVENVKYGIRISLGGAYNHIHDNTFVNVTKAGIFTYMGSDDPEASDDGRPSANIFKDNEFLNTDVGCNIKEGDDNVFSGNTFSSDKVTELKFSDSTNTDWTVNSVGPKECVEISDSSFTDNSDISTTECEGSDSDDDGDDR